MGASVLAGIRSIIIENKAFVKTPASMRMVCRDFSLWTSSSTDPPLLLCGKSHHAHPRTLVVFICHYSSQNPDILVATLSWSLPITTAPDLLFSIPCMGLFFRCFFPLYSFKHLNKHTLVHRGIKRDPFLSFSYPMAL